MAAVSSSVRGKTAPRNTQNALPNVASFSTEEELAAFRDMLLIRRFEEKAGQMYGHAMGRG